MFNIKNNIADLSDEQRELLKHADDACQMSYSPYSGFMVGAAARLYNGDIVKAANQESVSYPSGLCAERALLFSVMQNKDSKIDSIAISAIKDGKHKEVSPCGICRQTMLDMEQRQNSPIELIFFFEGRYVIAPSAKSLLPFSFETF